MNLSRREFLQILAAAGVAGFSLPACARLGAASKNPGDPYELPPKGNVSILHYTDCHGQLLPVYFREPHVNLGVADMNGRPPHLVGKNLLEHYGIDHPGLLSHAYTYLDYVKLAEHYGRVGGFAHLATLVKKIRDQRPGALLLDGGDTWGGGSGTGLWTNAQDMVDAQLKLGVDIMTGHWEYTFGADRVREILENDFAGHIEFLAQNVVDVDWGDRIFKPYTIREMNGVNVAVIGQAFPYTPIANPRHMIPEWSFGIRQREMQDTVNDARAEGAEVVILLSHNGMDVDIKLAQVVDGIDAIMGGHTHDAVPAPLEVKGPEGGICLVTNGGSNGKFLGVLDLDFRDGRIRDYQYRLLPVFANLIEPDPDMARYIEQVRDQEVTFDGQTFNMKDRLSEELAVSEDLLYRRGNFNGTFDQLICDALMEQVDAEIAFSPGFRWGTTVLPGMPITFEHIMDQTGLTYPAVTRNEMSGAMIKEILEDVADNLYNADPFYQQGGDMVRVGGLKYSIDPTRSIGERIADMELNGKPIDPNQNYVVAGWASVQEQPAGDTGRKIWDVVTDHLRDHETVSISELNEPKLRGVEGNPGLSSV
ncbi:MULTISPECIES: thiosulfohydrolase SoxB [Ectothiorhodospira]|uniref:thiosulfohydrolase SoxB n=1 Tax=Ectothiorhodospira TaxID=1051 RepID=UPI001EE8F7CF|nr:MULTISPECIES: thiosulfohydrolase SoxB [Ectothiorhodospira]MCG5493276.1 thiosulfohydrolase SoxB [Ectothiorhodospira variabilis]MCG5502605.1 thiosulfohydrolase SoxB [Ectothiorhodospira variabilis]MCG5505629.1 thiosulfohydrolase SoxB [Ectothiorhodospira variabilis]MCG5523333.1 thiosulfohydrolase SoxB [Ectothiorhodospira haloalkaliphila]